MKEYISVATERTARPEGILLPVEVLDNVFSTHLPTICANTVYPAMQTSGPHGGLMLITNVEGADELIALLRQLGTKRSVEIATLFAEARGKNR